MFKKFKLTLNVAPLRILSNNAEWGSSPVFTAEMLLPDKLVSGFLLFSMSIGIGSTDGGGGGGGGGGGPYN